MAMDVSDNWDAAWNAWVYEELKRLAMERGTSLEEAKTWLIKKLKKAGRVRAAKKLTLER